VLDGIKVRRNEADSSGLGSATSDCALIICSDGICPKSDLNRRKYRIRSLFDMLAKFIALHSEWVRLA
jgi:hypothetical protein